MSVYLRGGVYHYDFRFRGKRHRKSTEQTVRDDAERVEANAKDALRRVKSLTPETICTPLRERLVEILNGEHRAKRSIGSVYFVADGRLIKIGWTQKSARDRIITMQSGNPRPLELLATMPGTPAVERALHDHFVVDREMGEWFRTSQFLLLFIELLNRWPILDTLPAPPPIYTMRTTS